MKLEDKYQRHLDKYVRLEYYNQFLKKDGAGFMLGEHLGWETSELCKYLLEDSGFKKSEIESIISNTN